MLAKLLRWTGLASTQRIYRRRKYASRLEVRPLEDRTLLSFSMSLDAFWHDPQTRQDMTSTSNPGSVSITQSENSASVTTSGSASAQPTISSLSLSASAQASSQGIGVLAAETYIQFIYTVDLPSATQVSFIGTATANCDTDNISDVGAGVLIYANNTTVFELSSPSGSASISTLTDLPAGNSTFTIDVAADTRAAPNAQLSVDPSSASLNLLIQVGTAASVTSTALTSSANPAAFGQPVRFTATVSPSIPSNLAPTGTVTFMDGTTPIGSAPLQALNGQYQAVFTTTAALGVGSHSITASYSGDTTFASSTSDAFPQAVVEALTPQSLQWNDTLGGVDYSYQLAGGPLSQSTMVALYWSSTTNFSDHIGGPISGTTQTIAVGTQPATFGPIHITAAQLQNVPDGAAYLLVVTDPANKLATFSNGANVLAVPNQLYVSAGQFTFNAEGNDDPSSRYFSRQIHWPGGKSGVTSGVTIGRGYDLKLRSSAEIVEDLTASGVPLAQAQEIAAGAKLSGAAARNFVKRNRAIIGSITRAQQQALFSRIYGSYVDLAQVQYAQRVRSVPAAVPWDALDHAIQVILVDFVYNSGKLSKAAAQAASGNSYAALINYIQHNLKASARNEARIAYLQQYQ